eukprot:CAMPEP_0170252724 /NCGR_PEP_ID=MMETSP0116_2-20130129/26199_1 /TAXON_ID=400756 /ORGANISM="Durinskia baltica, Strain CSIRO CS-38" /LENGTH=320 /DNA_ID=CAMNT_0010503701 /DNA_START=32 /DNA_END=994 /DNA_ORIENTATION=-
MSTASSNPAQVLQDPALMSRRELQAALRALKLSSGGTTDQLRQRFLAAQQGSTEAGTKSSPAEAKPPANGDQEKRQRRFRDSCPLATRQRIERARTQTMYLVTKDELPDMQELCCNFVVLGSTGNVYNVAIKRVPHCTCPDHARGNLCKHILFVLLKVMRIPPDSPLIYQAAWIGSELEEMFEGMRARFQQVSGRVLACKAVQDTYARLGNGEEEEVASKVARRTDDEDCPICFDPLGPMSTTTFCRSQCGANFHNACISHWLRQQSGHPTCPMCRGSWEKPASKSQYTNLGHLQGQSPERDTSTYYTESFNRKKRRYGS